MNSKHVVQNYLLKLFFETFSLNSGVYEITSGSENSQLSLMSKQYPQSDDNPPGICLCLYG